MQLYGEYVEMEVGNESGIVKIIVAWPYYNGPAADVDVDVIMIIYRSITYMTYHYAPTQNSY